MNPIQERIEGLRKRIKDLQDLHDNVPGHDREGLRKEIKQLHKEIGKLYGQMYP